MHPSDYLRHFIADNARFDQPWRAAHAQRRGTIEPSCYVHVVDIEHLASAERPTWHVQAELIAAAWRVSQGIYRFDPDLASMLIELKCNGQIPATTLVQGMPEFCIWVEPVAELPGFFAMLSHGHGEPLLHLMTLAPDSYDQLRMSLVVGRSLEDALTDIVLGDETIPPEHQPDWASMIALLTYICASNCDYRNGIVPVHPSQKSAKQRMHARETVWEIGEHMGRTIRERRELIRRYDAGEGPVMGMRKRPHWRRWHYRTVHFGPRKGVPLEQQGSKLVLIEDTYVNGDVEDIEVTSHAVR